MPLKTTGQIERHEEESKQKYQLVASHNVSTIQMLEAQNEELREEVESLRCQLDEQHVNTEQHTNGNMNGSNGSTDTVVTDIALPQASGI